MQSDGLIDYLNRVQDCIKTPRQEMAIEGLEGSATAYFLSRLHLLEKERPVLIVTKDQNCVICCWKILNISFII